jgi:HK97 family phage portal protein
VGFLRDTLLGRSLARDLDEPLEGTNSTLWPAVSLWRSEVGLDDSGLWISPSMSERIWVCERSIQLNAQQIGAMPLRFHSSAGAGGFEPAWISNPDPNWFPNGIGDVLFSMVRSLYGRGFTVLQITKRYANGFPSAWTPLDPDSVHIAAEGGRRTYKVNEQPIDPADIVQIDRNPSTALHGTSALRAFASIAWGTIAAGELSRGFLQGGIPQAVLKSSRRVDKDQAEALQAQWVTATARRGGAPPVLPPEISFETLSIDPADLTLLESQEFGARALASAYGVPAILLNIPMTGGLNYQNPALLGEQWWRFELRTMAKRIEDAFSAQMLPRGNWVTLDAADTYSAITGEDDPQLIEEDPPTAAGASPSDAPSTVIPIRSVGGG